MDRSLTLTCPACHGRKRLPDADNPLRHRPCADCLGSGVEVMDIALSLHAYLAQARDLPHLTALLAQTVELADERALAMRRAGHLGHCNAILAIAGALAVVRDLLPGIARARLRDDAPYRAPGVPAPEGVEFLTRRNGHT